MRKLTVLICLIASIGFIYAQNVQVRGTVISAEDGEPISGVSVIVKGNVTIGTVTDSEGRFSLSVPQSATTLIVRYVGMEEQEVAVSTSDIRVVLKELTSELDEIVVVGYGVTKKASFPGAASTIKGSELEKVKTSNLSKALEGQVAGLETTSGSGQPGAGASVIIRGLGSISASRAPLIILDGIAYEGDLNSISSFDVEAMTVLKDAAANSIYGARGSNGVIIVTTKKGKSGKARVSFDARLGANSRGIPAYDIITDPGEFYEMYWESLRNRNYYENRQSMMTANRNATANLITGGLQYNIYKNIPDNQLIDPLTGKLNPNAREKKWNDSWLNDPFRNGLVQEYNVGISSGTENNNLYMSLNYLTDEGYIVNSDFNRISARLRTEQKIGEFVKLEGSVNYTRTDMNTVSASTTQYSNMFMFGQQIAPIYPIYLYDLNTGDLILDANGKKQYDFGSTYARPYASEQNPLATVEAGENKALVDNMRAMGLVEVKFLKNFKFSTHLAYDIYNSKGSQFMTPIGGDALNVNGRAYRSMSRYSALNAYELLNYNNTFGLHSVDVLLGHENKADNVSNMYGHMTNFVNPYNSEFANAALYQELTSTSEEYALEGYFGRVEYNFDEKYYLTASLRTDASSRFHPDIRWGTFWAIGGSWRISKELFLQDVSYINDLKLKVSYGTQGNDNIGTWYAYRDLFAVDRIDGEPALSLTFRGNPKLTWEKSDNFNTGIELKAWDNRISLNFDYFIKETKDLLYAKPRAASEGLPNFQWVNDIDMKNTGYELELGVDIIHTNDFKWNVNLNMSHYKNQITKLPVDKQVLIDRDGGYQVGSYWYKIGGSIYDFFTYEYVGVDPENGLAQYNQYKTDDAGVETVTKVNVTSDATLRETGKSAVPDLYGGLGTTLDFMGFDLSIRSAFQLGGYVMDGVYQEFMHAGDAGRNFHKDMFKRWTPENPTAEVPRLHFNNLEQNGVSDRWLTKASYFSLRNITLGYTLPKKTSNFLKLERLRIYAVADNVWYTSNRKGLDVRQSFTGSVAYAYSPLRTMSFGISASF